MKEKYTNSLVYENYNIITKNLETRSGAAI